MTPPRGLHSKAMRGVAQRLADSGLGVWSGDAPAEYGPNDTLITLLHLPEDPDAAIAVSLYDGDDELRLPNVGLLVQLLIRVPGPADAVADVAEAAFGVLHGVHHDTWGELRVQSARRISFAQLGADSNGRHERSDNYRIVTQRPGGTP
ncbi:minor capsid protein [Cellulomonas olei]|uniref:minor capsid protein n=1 Tax=Cellulomonas sp. P4 TaxID=3142533 RepID=UPI0031BA2C0E